MEQDSRRKAVRPNIQVFSLPLEKAEYGGVVFVINWGNLGQITSSGFFWPLRPYIVNAYQSSL